MCLHGTRKFFDQETCVCWEGGKLRTRKYCGGINKGSQRESTVVEGAAIQFRMSDDGKSRKEIIGGKPLVTTLAMFGGMNYTH